MIINKVINKYKLMNVQAKAAIWFVACSFLQKGISFITVPIFTRLMTTSEYGIYNIYISWFQVLTIVSSLNLFYGVLDNGLTKFENDRDRYIASMQGVTVSLTLILFIVYILFSNQFSKALGLSKVLIFLMFIEMLVSPALLFWSGRQRFEYRYKQLVVITLLRSVLNPVLGIIFILCVDASAEARVAAMIITELIISGSLMIKQFLKGKKFFYRPYWKYGLSLAIPMLPHYLAGTILNQGDRIMINNLVGSTSVAYYSVAYSIGMLANIFTNAINSSITPWLYKKLKDNDLIGTKEVINGLLILVSIIALCMMIVSPEVVLFFGSGKYLMGQYVIPPVAGSVFFIFLYGIFSLPQFYYEKTKFLMFASIGAAILNIVLNYIFIKLFGFIAAGYTTLLCYVLYSIGHYLMSSKVLKNKNNSQNLFDIHFIFILSIGLILFSIGINFLFPYKYIRYLILFIIVILIYIKRNYILKNLSNLKK